MAEGFGLVVHGCDAQVLRRWLHDARGAADISTPASPRIAFLTKAPPLLDPDNTTIIIRTRKEEMNSLSTTKVLSVKPLVCALKLLRYQR